MVKRHSERICTVVARCGEGLADATGSRVVWPYAQQKVWTTCRWMKECHMIGEEVEVD